MEPLMEDMSALNHYVKHFKNCSHSEKAEEIIIQEVWKAHKND